MTLKEKQTAMEKETAINDLLKYAKIIGKQPNEPQRIEIENAVKIALRIGFEAGVKFKELENINQKTI